MEKKEAEKEGIREIKMREEGKRREEATGSKAPLTEKQIEEHGRWKSGREEWEKYLIPSAPVALVLSGRTHDKAITEASKGVETEAARNQKKNDK